ncbi:MAG: bifunctional riboflavin kinase/FAD synthetase [Thermodesulfobacteriota bacterium]
MEIILGLDQLKRPLNNPVVTLGNFDGVHLGHQSIFRRVKEEAQKIKGEAVVITFEPHPLKILSPQTCPPLLTPFKKKMMFIEKSGIDTVLCIEFTQNFSEISPFDFIKNILMEKVKPRKIVVGYNYHFGKGHRGDVEILKQVCKLFNVDVDVMAPLRIGSTTVSSSKIRELIKDGKVEEASRLLGRNYPVIGKVVRGVKRGQTLGFPTANLEISEDLYPKKGVYAVEVVWNEQRLDGVANVGVNPTFYPAQAKGENPLLIEVYILNFRGDLYGEQIQVNFIRRIRDETRFDSSAELIEQINKDVEWAQKNVFHVQE